MSLQVNQTDNSLSAWKNWGAQQLANIGTNIGHAHHNVQAAIGHGTHQVQVLHMSFFQSCAQGLNQQLKNMIDDGDVKATKAIFFNTTTVLAVASVALYVLGGMSFLGAAALIAFSLVGRTTVLQSFENVSLRDVISEDSIAAYLEPERLLESAGYPVFYNMNPIIKIALDNDSADGKYLNLKIRLSQNIPVATNVPVVIATPVNASQT